MLSLLLLAAARPPLPDPTWEKVVLDRAFRGEGVAVADVDRDGKPDVLAGELWYRAPDWTPHPMQPVGDYGTGEKNYSKVFACWADDFNADGFPDLLVIDFPGVPCYWLENPKGNRDVPWQRHPVWHSACNETPQYADLLGTGKRVLVMGFQPKGAKPDGNMGRMAYFTPKPGDPTAEWDMHPISVSSEPGKPVPGTNRFSHGLGVGDVNADGRRDVITAGGWWEHPADPAAGPWPFHPLAFVEPVADIHALDVDGDRRPDLLTTSAHKFGVYLLRQQPANGPHPTFEPVTLFGRLVSETHASVLADIDGDGQVDWVLGKRWWSHGRQEPGSGWDARLYYLKGERERDGFVNWRPRLIDADSGVGTQFAVADVDGDGRPDVVTSNKKGVRVLFQRPPK